MFSVATLLYSNAVLTLWQISPVAFLGALLGDHAGFYLGLNFGTRLHDYALAKRYRTSLQKGEQLILRYGASAIFIGRFIPAIRSLIPALLGVSAFSTRRYNLLASMACAVWAALLAVLVWSANGIL